MKHIFRRHFQPGKAPKADKFRDMHEAVKLTKETFDNPDTVKSGRFRRTVREKQFVDDTGTKGQKNVRVVTEAPVNGEEELVTSFPFKTIIEFITPAAIEAWFLAKEEAAEGADAVQEEYKKGEAYERQRQTESVNRDPDSLEKAQ